MDHDLLDDEPVDPDLLDAMDDALAERAAHRGVDRICNPGNERSPGGLMPKLVKRRIRATKRQVVAG
jgi:hypothetical protein